MCCTMSGDVTPNGSVDSTNLNLLRSIIRRNFFRGCIVMDTRIGSEGQAYPEGGAYLRETAGEFTFSHVRLSHVDELRGHVHLAEAELS